MCDGVKLQRCVGARRSGTSLTGDRAGNPAGLNRLARFGIARVERLARGGRFGLQSRRIAAETDVEHDDPHEPQIVRRLLVAHDVEIAEPPPRQYSVDGVITGLGLGDQPTPPTRDYTARSGTLR